MFASVTVLWCIRLYGLHRWSVQPGGECDGGGTDPEEQSRALGKGTRENKRTHVRTHTRAHIKATYPDTSQPRSPWTPLLFLLLLWCKILVSIQPPNQRFFKMPELLFKNLMGFIKIPLVFSETSIKGKWRLVGGSIIIFVYEVSNSPFLERSSPLPSFPLLSSSPPHRSCSWSWPPSAASSRSRWTRACRRKPPCCPTPSSNLTALTPSASRLAFWRSASAHVSDLWLYRAENVVLRGGKIHYLVEHHWKFVSQEKQDSYFFKEIRAQVQQMSIIQ